MGKIQSLLAGISVILSDTSMSSPWELMEYTVYVAIAATILCMFGVIGFIKKKYEISNATGVVSLFSLLSSWMVLDSMGLLSFLFILTFSFLIINRKLEGQKNRNLAGSLSIAGACTGLISLTYLYLLLREIDYLSQMDLVQRGVFGLIPLFFFLVAFLFTNRKERKLREAVAGEKPKKEKKQKEKKSRKKLFGKKTKEIEQPILIESKAAEEVVQVTEAYTRSLAHTDVAEPMLEAIEKKVEAPPAELGKEVPTLDVLFGEAAPELPAEEPTEAPSQKTEEVVAEESKQPSDGRILSLEEVFATRSEKEEGFVVPQEAKELEPVTLQSVPTVSHEDLFDEEASMDQLYERRAEFYQNKYKEYKERIAFYQRQIEHYTDQVSQSESQLEFFTAQSEFYKLQLEQLRAEKEADEHEKESLQEGEATIIAAPIPIKDTIIGFEEIRARR